MFKLRKNRVLNIEMSLSYAMSFFVFTLVIVSCTEPVNPNLDSEQGLPDSESASTACETHQDCESNVCDGEGFCEEEINIVYVNQATGVPGGC